MSTTMSVLKGIVDKGVPTPLYYQLQQILQNAIDAGDLTEGDVIPTEMELAEHYNISRATVRQATQQLVNEGYLWRERSKGTIVTIPRQKVQFMGELRGFSAEMIQRKIAYHSHILDVKKTTIAKGHIAENLQLAPGADIVYLKRLRFLQDRPFLIVENFIDYRLCPGLEKRTWHEHDSLYIVLEQEYGLVPHHGWREFEPMMPCKEDIEFLKVEPDTPILYAESIAFMEDGRPLECYIARSNGRYRVNLLAQP